MLGQRLKERGNFVFFLFQAQDLDGQADPKVEIFLSLLSEED